MKILVFIGFLLLGLQLGFDWVEQGVLFLAFMASVVLEK